MSSTTEAVKYKVPPNIQNMGKIQTPIKFYSSKQIFGRFPIVIPIGTEKRDAFSVHFRDLAQKAKVAKIA